MNSRQPWEYLRDPTDPDLLRIAPTHEPVVGATDVQPDRRERHPGRVAPPVRSPLSMRLERSPSVLPNAAAGAAAEPPPEDLIERFERPVLLLDASRLIRFENGAATEALARLEYVMRRHGRLHCTLAENDEALGRAIDQLHLDGRSRSSRTPDRRFVRIETVADRVPVGAYLVAMRTPLRPDPARADALVMVFFHDVRQNPGLDPDVVADTFGLTPAEARLAVTLASGVAVKTIAAQRRVEVSTVRTQLRSILAKTGTNRQAELVRVLLGLPAVRPRF